MIASDVRIQEYKATIGHQYTESYITCYAVQIFVFDKWWTVYDDDENKQDLQNAIKLRDEYLSIIKGR